MYFNRHDEDKKKCIIYNGDEMEKMGRFLQVTIITLHPDHPDAVHVAEKTLIRFADIQQKHHTKKLPTGYFSYWESRACSMLIWGTTEIVILIFVAILSKSWMNQ